MDSTDLTRIERRTRIHYEWSRARRALLGFAPSWVLVALAAAFGARPGLSLAFGGALFLWGALLLWRGRELKRAVLPGVVAGLFPLVLAICANQFGHACLDGSCTSLCIPACIIGGATAGLALAVFIRRGNHGGWVWASASGAALLTGGMGCVCIGVAGVVGLASGYFAGSLPLLLWPVRSRP